LSHRSLRSFPQLHSLHYVTSVTSLTSVRCFSYVSCVRWVASGGLRYVRCVACVALGGNPTLTFISPLLGSFNGGVRPMQMCVVKKRSVHNFLSYLVHTHTQTNKNRKKHNLLGGGYYYTRQNVKRADACLIANCVRSLNCIRYNYVTSVMSVRCFIYISCVRWVASGWAYVTSVASHALS